MDNANDNALEKKTHYLQLWFQVCICWMLKNCKYKCLREQIYLFIYKQDFEVPTFKVNFYRIK